MPMKLIIEYLEYMRRFERMASEESHPKIRAVFQEQAAKYRKRALERIQKLGGDPARFSIE
jgi:hypothetical protein